VGPPGCGKSALVAKLASHFVNEKKARVALRSLDDFKPNAINEIERYGKLLNVPCFSGNAVIEEWDSSGVVLIDTAGLPVGADSDREVLKEMLSPMNVDEIHLVLPAYCRFDDLRVWYEFYRPLGITSTAITHLDETRSVGAVLSLALLEQCRFSYFSSGRTSAADLEVANLQKLAELLLDAAGGVK
jgi:flagellar biosynthesis protein FlhF